MRENSVEKAFIKACKRHGIRQHKWTTPNAPDAPDRIVFLYATTVFVELKRPGEEPTVTQVMEHNDLRELGFSVYVVDTTRGSRELVARLKEEHEDAQAEA